MNIQPYDTPPRFWAPKLRPWCFRLMRVLRDRDLRKQRIVEVELRGLEHLRTALRGGQGVLITPNHSFHFDSYCLLRAADAVRRPFYTMTAWQVFGMSSWLGRWTLQRSGCFSVNREAADLEAFRAAVDILQFKPYPLVIFPEGDIYHTNDKVTPFRDGAAAIALSAARKTRRAVVCLPTAIKSWYVSDPTPQLRATAEQLERRLWWRPVYDMPLPQRVYRLAEGLLALKEYELLGRVQLGSVRERIRRLSGYLLDKHENQYAISQPSTLIPERVKEVRRRIIMRLRASDLTEQDRRDLRHDLEEMFFVTQLYSYPGDYVGQEPSIERLAETLDKLEEDLLGVVYPAVHGERRVVVQFDRPLVVPRERGKKGSIEALTNSLEQRVQHMLDTLNAEHGLPPRHPIHPDPALDESA